MNRCRDAKKLEPVRSGADALHIGVVRCAHDLVATIIARDFVVPMKQYSGLAVSSVHCSLPIGGYY